MSHPRDGRDDQPSTSSGYRRDRHGSHSRTPYSRPQDPKEHPGRGVVKNLRESSEYGSSQAASSSSLSPSTSTHLEQPHDTRLIKIEPVEYPGNEKQLEVRRRVPRETIYVTKPSNLVTKKGKSGQQIILQTNYFNLQNIPDWQLYKYHVDYEPEEERTAVRKGMLKLHKEKVGPYIFDGSTLFASTRLPDKLELLSVRKSDDAHIKIIIRFVGHMLPADPQYIQVFNIIMRRCLEHLNLKMIGRNYYDANAKITLHEHKLQLWPGYITSIRRHEHNVLMCCEVSHKVLRDQTVLDMLHDCYRRNKYEYKNMFCKSIIGLSVHTLYNKHVYRIEDVDFDANPTSTFTRKGETISYQQYYLEKYVIKIKDITQPMLVTRSRPNERNAGKGEFVYLVPELCHATGLTDTMRENFHLMRALAEHTRINPEARIAKLRTFNQRLRREPKIIEELKDWNMELSANLVEVSGRILSPVELMCGNNQKVNALRGDWTRDMQRTSLFRRKELKSWIVIGSDRERNIIEPFINTLRQVSYGISFEVHEPYRQYLRDDKANTYTEHLEYLLSKKVPDLVFCVVSNNRADRYVAIKKKCCVDRPVPSQVFLQKNLSSKNVMSIATKVAIQMNCKMGGAPWNIENPVNGLMAIGFDICHDTAIKGRHFLAMVATVEKSLTQFYSSIALYHNDDELIEQICLGVSKAIQKYRSNNRALPMCILIYRDGVSEGEVKRVCEKEVEDLKKKLEEMYYGPNFKMLFIIVSKKIRTTLFYNRGNPPAGTIVDDVVTSPFKYDFFLVSQHVRQGTVSPTLYSIVSNNTSFDPETIQTITFRLTHMYFNCSNTVRVPAPCHYAQKLSQLVGRHLHCPPKTDLENQLYFL